MQPTTIELALLANIVGGQQPAPAPQAPAPEDTRAMIKGYLKECAKGAAGGAIGGALAGPKTAAIGAAIGCTTNVVIRAIDRNL